MKALDCPEITVEALGELGEQLGGGGVSVVYRATWKGQPVAVKLTQEEANDSLVEEYRNELQVMTQLDHPNIIRLLGASLVPPKLCIVMELCGPSLHKLLHQSAERFDHIRRLQIAQDVAEALRYLHAFEVPVIHRDIKSQNIVVDNSTGTSKLIDFGLASTRVVAAGTPSYMAPELLAVRAIPDLPHPLVATPCSMHWQHSHNQPTLLSGGNVQCQRRCIRFWRASMGAVQSRDAVRWLRHPDS